MYPSDAAQLHWHTWAIVPTATTPSNDRGTKNPCASQVLTVSPVLSISHSQSQAS